jgi:DNA-binding NarL/FixJ family response regulator
MDYQVMIVDDSKLARMSIANAVARLYPNWRLLEAGNAEIAMTLALAERIDIVLIDYNMPGRDGLSLAADLRDLHPAMPMALITANFQAEIVAGAKELSVTFLGKPHWQDGLAAFLSDVIGRLRLDG